MFESAEEKAEVLEMIDRMHKAIEDENLKELQTCALEAFVIFLRSFAKDVPGALPLVIMEKNP